MSNTNKNEQQLIIKGDNEEKRVYKYNEMKDEQKIVYAKIVDLVNESHSIRQEANKKLEQNHILQKHYLAVLEDLLENKDEKETE
jgi:hypothetical protein